VKFTGQPGRDHACCWVVVLEQQVSVGAHDPPDDDSNFCLARPIQRRANARHRFVDDKFQYVGGVLALAQQARNDAGVHDIDRPAVCHRCKLGLDIDRCFFLVVGSLDAFGTGRFSVQQRLSQQVVKLFELGHIERPAAIPQCMAKPVAAVFLVVGADVADKCCRVHRCRIGG
jgi:hypothetical protein